MAPSIPSTSPSLKNSFENNQRQWHGWLAPLAHQIDRWLWLSVVASFGMLASLTISPQCHSTTRQDDGKQRPVVVLALVAVGMFYNIILLMLSAKERRITAQAKLSRAIDGRIEEGDDEESRATARGSVVFLMLVVCQNGLAVLGLYIGIRVIFLLRSPLGTAYNNKNANVAYSEFGYVVGQLALMVFVIFRCMVHDAKLGKYLPGSQEVYAPEKQSLLCEEESI